MKLRSSSTLVTPVLVRSTTVLVASLALLVASLVAVTAPTPAAAQSGDCQIQSPADEFDELVAESVAHAQIWRLYQAFFLRQPDTGGLNYWLGVANQGNGLEEIAYQFAYSEEFQLRYGAITDDQFVELIYRNVLCRPAEDEGAAYWKNILATGAAGRHQVVVYFSEAAEYLMRTDTCHSVFADQNALLTGCPEPTSRPLVPLASATLEVNGYEAVSTQIGGGTFRGTMVDLSAGVLATGSSRCAVSSINGNWLSPSNKDSAAPSVLGIGVVNGSHVKGSADRDDFGIFGMRYDSDPHEVAEVWPGDTLSPDDKRLNSVVYADGVRAIEIWHGGAETSIYMTELLPEALVSPDEWQWAASGIPIIFDGQLDSAFWAAYRNDPYTFQTRTHPFLVADHDTNRLMYGAVSGADVGEITNWAIANGYEDLMKFDGGGSVEYNVARRPVVDSTPRNIPVWIGIGCG